MKKTKPVTTKIDLAKVPQKPGKRTLSKEEYKKIHGHCGCWGQCYSCRGHDSWVDAEIARLMEKDD